jgi:hypothetical protein
MWHCNIKYIQIKKFVVRFSTVNIFVFSTRRSQMEIEVLIGLIVIVGLGYLVFRSSQTTTSSALDVNKDGKVDVKDAVAVAVKVEEAVVTEVKEVVTKAKTAAKKVAAKKPAKTAKAAKKPAPAKKTPAKKAPAKKPK